MDDDYIQQLEERPIRRGKKGGFVSATEQLPDDAAEQVKPDSTRVDAHHKRHTIVVRDEWIERIEAIASELGTNKTDAWKTILILGFRAHVAGERLQVQAHKRAFNVLVESE